MSAKRPEPGDVVEFLNRNYHEYTLEQARRKLVQGQRYTVRNIYVDNWGIYLYLEGIEGQSFRAEMFAYIDSSKTQKKSEEVAQ